MFKPLIIGVDRGTTFTKTSSGTIFKSTVTKDDGLKMGLKVEFKEERYIVGENGNYETNLMKASNENTELLVYTAISQSIEDEFINVNLVVGLPVGLYSEQKNKMKELFEGKEETITINEKNKYISIKRCEVFPEGAGMYYCQDDKDCIIVDIGGISIDNALFIDGKLSHYSTYQMGVMKLYSKMINLINSKYDLNLKEWDIPKILNEGLYIYGEKMDLDFDNIIDSYVGEIIERLSLEYDLKSTKIILGGGGAILLEDYFKKNTPHSKRFGNQFSNAKGFKIIGGAIFK